MPSETNPACFHLSASSIQAFKACPTRFRLGYREGLRTDRDTDSQRMGTHWHALHEVYANTLLDNYALTNDEDGKAGAMVAVVEHLNQRYADCPTWIDIKDWALERQILLTSFAAYHWYWQNDQVDFLASEVPFNLPVHEPRTGLPLRMDEVQRVGKIDHIVKWHGAICSLERKSTSRSIAPDSDYWEVSQKDTQVSMYALAFDDMLKSPGGSVLPDAVRHDMALTLAHGGTNRVGNTLYDVWHKPTTRPTWLTQAETKAFLETGAYEDQSFGMVVGGPITVNGETVEIEQGKKGFAIKETVEMYGARLLQDIYKRPEFYFARREIARTAAEIREFRGELFAVYQMQKLFSKTGHWFSNEKQCRATFPCAYIPICYGPRASAVCDGKTVPPNFKRIFVDLTINGKGVE